MQPACSTYTADPSPDPESLTHAKDERLGQLNPWWFDTMGALRAPDPAGSRGL